MAVTLDPIGGGGRSRMGPRFRPRAEINVTPFVDVMLVLLIVFMVTAPLLTVGELVELPRTDSPSLPADDIALAVTVTAEGVVTIQETQFPLEEVAVQLRRIAAQGQISLEDRIYVYGDATADYGDVLKVFREISNGGFSNLALVTNLPLDDETQ